MDQSHLVGAVQRRRNLFDHRDRALRAEPFAVLGDVLGQVAALDQPHVDIQLSVDLAVIVDGHHVGVVEACRDACLAPEAFLELGVLGEMRGQHLEGNDPVGAGVVGAEDLSHPASPQHIQQLVMAE